MQIAQPVSRGLVLLTLAVLNQGCTPPPIKLPPASPNVSVRIPIPARIEVPQDTAAAQCQAGKFKILVGEAVVQYAHAFLDPAFPQGDDLLVAIQLKRVAEENYRVYVALEFIVSRGKQEVFRWVYDETGPGNYWDAMGNAEGILRESTNVALRSVFKQFLSEAQRANGAW